MPDSSATQLDFNKLPRYRPRRFVPDDTALVDAKEVVALCEKLLAREVASRKKLEAWLADRSEFEAALDEAGSVIYVRMTCQTDDKTRANVYKSFITAVEPLVRAVSEELASL